MKMNSIKNIKVALLCGGVVLAGACTKDFDKINIPPNSAVKVNPDYVVSNVQRNASFDKIDLVPGVLMFGNWVQHWGNQNAGFTTAHYLAIPNYDDGLWGSHYAYLKDLNMAETDLLAGQEEAPEGRSKVAEIRIMKAMIAERLTALVGDIPYTQAVSTPGKIVSQPEFDTQESIYPQLIASLDEARARITPGDVTFGNADFYFNGDPEKWKKFANALKMRTAMRMKYANPGAAQAAVTAAMGQPLPASLADAAFVATDAANRNTGHRIWQRSDLDKTNAPMMGETLINTLVAKNDPRLPLIADPTPNSKNSATPVYRGVPPALSGTQYSSLVTADYSYPSSKTFLNPAIAVPSSVLTYGEVAFLKAEAALEGWGGTEAQAEQFYQDGIRAAMAREPYKVSAALIDEYIAREGTLTGTKEEKLEQIMTQKWIELFDNSYEAFIEWRRTGYPRLKPGQNPGETNGTIPRRAKYSTVERSLNGANYDAAVQRQGPDLYTTRVWIDKRP
jgi:hypothetical protein